MKIGLKAFACLAALASVTGCAESGEARVLEGMIRTTMRRNGIMGMSAVVVSADRRLLEAGYGFADRSRRIPVTPETLFPLASVTKLFTATAVMQLVERGLVDLDSPVSRYLPEMTRPGTMEPGPTVRQLLTHHGGIPGNIMEGFELLRPDPTRFREVPRLLGGTPAASAPDTVFAYSNSGYSLLGCLVERASGNGYNDFVTRGILGPLGMSRTRFFLSPADSEGTAMGYEGSRQVPVYPMRDIPAGALMSSGEDMEKFMGFVFDRGRGGVLGRAAFTEMMSRQNEGVALDGDFSIGLGYWLIRSFPVQDEFASHAGDMPPFHTVLVTIPERRIEVFLAANSSRDSSALIPLAVELVRAAYSWQTGVPVEDPQLPRRAPLDKATLDGLAGRYASPMGLIEVQPRGGRLLTRVESPGRELPDRPEGREHQLPRVHTSFPLLAPNDGEAVIAGKGTGLGDSITARDKGGEVFLEWSGLLLRRER